MPTRSVLGNRCEGTILPLGAQVKPAPEHGFSGTALGPTQKVKRKPQKNLHISGTQKTTDNSPYSQAWRGEGLWWGQRASKPLQKRKGRWLQSARHSSHDQKRREGKSQSCRLQKMLERAGSHRDTAQRKAARRRTDLRKQPELAKMTAKPRGPCHQQTGPKPKTALKGVPEQSSTRRENSAFADPHSKVVFHKKEKRYRIL